MLHCATTWLGCLRTIVRLRREGLGPHGILLALHLVSNVMVLQDWSF